MTRRISDFLLLTVCLCALAPEGAATGLSLPPGTQAILEQIYSGQGNLAIPAAQALQL